MKSPFTGGKAVLQKEARVLEYRKESFTVVYNFYVCEDSHEQFTTTQLDILNLNQIHNKYRAKYGIPFTDEIRNIREKYGLSAAKMSEVLGLGTNVYRQYEAGEMPSVATGRLIRMAEDPREFIKLVNLGRNAFEPHEFDKVLKKIHQSHNNQEDTFESQLERYALGATYPNMFNGYRTSRLEKVGLMVRYLAKQLKPYTTALNKLMFYADFSHYQQHGFSISGLTYKAIQWGPVPENYGTLYNHLVNTAWVKLQVKEQGERFFWNDPVELITQDNIFSHEEISTMQAIVKRFRNIPTREIVRISHEEAAWQNNASEKDIINYEYSFELKHHS